MTETLAARLLRQIDLDQLQPGIPLGRRDALGFALALITTGLTVRTGLAQAPTLRGESGPPDPRDVADPRAQFVESWSEPWIWRPSDWPNDVLDLNFVAYANQPAGASPGNPFIPLFSYNGSSPAPTIRMRGDETLRIRLRNLMGRNFGAVPIGPAPDIFETPPERFLGAICRIVEAKGITCDLTNLVVPAEVLAEHFDELYSEMDVEFIEVVYLSTPANARHAVHTTNLHTHGLHVAPEFNPNGLPADNILLRVIPREDLELRQEAADPSLRGLSEHERVGEAEFEHGLGDVQRARRLASDGPMQPHPPGTHWYHPHAHGATHDQVASGMAGFLIVEGDVDDAISLRMTATANPDPALATGPFDYRERLILVQRVFVNSFDVDSGPRRNQARATSTTINGAVTPPIMFMRPGSVERWRILNGSVDGRGFKNFMVLDGQFVFNEGQLWRVIDGVDDNDERRFEAVGRQEMEDAKVGIHQLAFDGITLVSVEDGRARYRIKDLSEQNPGTLNPLDREPEPGEDRVRALLRNVEDCYRDGDSIRNAYVRPNQIFLANANRADVIFKAPTDADGRIYTLLAQEFFLQSDNYQQQLQISVANAGAGFPTGNPSPVDVVVGHVRVAGEPVEGGDFDIMSLNDVMPEVPPYLLPIEDEELRVPDDEAVRRDIAAGSVRTRVVSYSGIGPTDFPVIEVPERFARQHPELRGGLWEEINGAKILFPPYSGTMAIHSDLDLAFNPEPGSPSKFGHTEQDEHPKTLVESSEEWVLYNLSGPLWSHTDLERYPQPGQYLRHFRAYPIGRAEGQTRFAEDPEFRISSKGADHPFHIHINPCWVTRIEVPDETGRLHNILPEPVWMDTVSIPRDGGRVVFRSRFTDYVGKWVNHCHILSHEDRGMMQMVECVARAEDANYHARRDACTHEMASEDVDRIYPRPSRELMYRQNLSFVDTHPLLGYSFPGFELELPELDD